MYHDFSLLYVLKPAVIVMETQLVPNKPKWVFWAAAARGFFFFNKY